MEMHVVFCCSDTGRKVDDPELLEAIRLTILNNMITYHPVSSMLLNYPIILERIQFGYIKCAFN
jgi:hypothetical protein